VGFFGFLSIFLLLYAFFNIHKYRSVGVILLLPMFLFFGATFGLLLEYLTKYSPESEAYKKALPETKNKLSEFYKTKGFRRFKIITVVCLSLFMLLCGYVLFFDFRKISWLSLASLIFLVIPYYYRMKLSQFSRETALYSAKIDEPTSFQKSYARAVPYIIISIIIFGFLLYFILIKTSP
jgi:hypothetical protein